MLDIHEIYNKKMENLVNYDLTEGFEHDKNGLMGLNYYVAKVNEDRKCYVKPKSYIILLKGTCEIMEKLENGDFSDTSDMYDANSNVVYITGYPYGFRTRPFQPKVDFQFDFSHYDTSKITMMNNMFNGYNSSAPLDLSNFDTSNVTNMSGLFYMAYYVKEINISSFVMSKVKDVGAMFYENYNLEKIYMDNFDVSHITSLFNYSAMFRFCNSLNYIRCKQAFKDWCIANQDNIYLPTQMREGGSGTWDIVG